MKNNSYLIPRRSVLKGLGASLAIPVLEIMSPALCYGATKKSHNKDKALRLCVLYKGCGVNPNSWDIHDATETDFEMSKILQPLKANKNDLLILRNLDNSGRGGHLDAPMAFMSGIKKKSNFKQTYSFDQVIADEIGHKTPLKSLQLTADNIWKEHPWINNLSHDKNGNPMPGQGDPELVFNKLFKGLNNASYRNNTASVLDAVDDSAKKLVNKASKQDREVLEQYFQSIREVEKNISQAKSNIDAERQQRISQIKPIPAVGNLADRMKAMLDLLALAFWTDSTRIASFMMANTNSRCTYDFIGVKEEFHYLSHFVRNRAARERFDQVNMWHSAQFAYFINKLKSFKDGNESLYDNSLILFGSGIKHGDYHSLTDVPVILSGGAAGQLNTGRHVHYPTEQPFSNLLLNMMDMMGVKKDKIGLSDGRLQGISEKANFKPRNPDDGSWKVIKDDGKKNITIKGLLKNSQDASSNLYLLRLSNKQNFHIHISFMNAHKKAFDDNVGKIVIVTGEYIVKDGRKIMKTLSKVEKQSVN